METIHLYDSPLITPSSKLNDTVFASIKHYFTYLKCRERKRSFIYWSLPKWPQWSALGQAKKGTRNSIQVIHVGCRGPSTWEIFYFLPRCINRELHCQWKSWDSDMECWPFKQQINLQATTGAPDIFCLWKRTWFDVRPMCKCGTLECLHIPQWQSPYWQIAIC